MPEQLLRLSPHRDLQCYFFQPSAIAAMSSASATGFNLTGSWRTQWDWAVVEWNADNGFEHPALRYLPEMQSDATGANYKKAGDFTGVTLSYVEQRTNCMPFESNLYPTLDWPYLRIWVPNRQGGEDVWFVRLADYAKPLISQSAYVPAQVTMTLTGTVTMDPSAQNPPPTRVGLAFTGTFASATGTNSAPVEQHYYFSPSLGMTLTQVAQGIVNAINDTGSGSPDIRATVNGTSITCTYLGANAVVDLTESTTGANGNRVGCYGFASYGLQLSWMVGDGQDNRNRPYANFGEPATSDPNHKYDNLGKFPLQYQIQLPFDNLKGFKNYPSQFFDPNAQPSPVPTNSIRKMRWMWAPDITPPGVPIGPFKRTEWSVTVSNWAVTGNFRTYSVAGPGSRRIEDTDQSVVYSATNGSSDWSTSSGNYSGGRITRTTTPQATYTIAYTEPAAHRLYLGVERIGSSANISVTIDGVSPVVDGVSLSSVNLKLPLEDELARLPLGPVGAGSHTVVVTHNGGPNETLAFDFLEVAYPTQDLPDFPPQPNLALATDWDTLHSQALPAERTAWMIQQLGFRGRVNHYVGALWWYELTRPGQTFASLTVTIDPGVKPSVNQVTTLWLGNPVTTIQHVNLPDDNANTIAIALVQRINQGAVAVWASAQANVVTITWRFIAGDLVNPPQGDFSVTSPNSGQGGFLYISVPTEGTPGVIPAGYSLSGDSLAAKIQAFTAYFRTDLNYSARINRACRDWSQAFFTALQSYQPPIDCVAAFSTELGHVDPTPAAHVDPIPASGGMTQRHPDGSPCIVSTPAIQTNFSPTSIAFWSAVYFQMATLQQNAGMTPYLQSGEVQWWYFPNAAGMPYYDDYTKQQFQAQYGTQMGLIQNGGADPSAHPNEAAFLNGELANFTASMRNAINQVNTSARYEVLYPCDVNDPTVYPFNQAVNLATSDWRPSNLACFKSEALAFVGPGLIGPDGKTVFGARSLDKTAATLQIGTGFPTNQRSHLVLISDPFTAWAKEVDLALAHGMESVVLFALDQYCLIGYPLPPFTNQRWSKRAA